MATRTIHLPESSYALLSAEARRRGVDPDALADELVRADLAAHGEPIVLHQLNDTPAVVAMTQRLERRCRRTDAPVTRCREATSGRLAAAQSGST